MKKKSIVIRGVSKNARFFIADTTEIVREAKRLHDLDPTATVLFGKVLTIAVIMGQDIKSVTDTLTVKTEGDGLYGRMLAIANGKGEVKGYPSMPYFDEKTMEEMKDSKIDFLGEGVIQVVKDLGLKAPFVGSIKIEGDDIAQNMVRYFYESDQVKSVVSLGVKLDDNFEVVKAGGFVLQLLPGVEDGFIDKLEKKIQSIQPVTELMSNGFDCERIVKLLYEDMEDENYEKLIENYEVLSESEVEYKCDCSKDDYLAKLRSLGEKQLKELLEENGEIEVECHFCGNKYQYKEEDVF